jgi:hypothetical protein
VVTVVTVTVTVLVRTVVSDSCDHTMPWFFWTPNQTFYFVANAANDRTYTNLDDSLFLSSTRLESVSPKRRDVCACVWYGLKVGGQEGWWGC